MRTKLLLCLLLPVLAAACQAGRDALDLAGLGGEQLTDEEQIHLVLDEIQRGLESKRIYRVLSHISRNYEDDEGRDYRALQRELNQKFKQYRDIEITRPRPRLIVQGDRARAVETYGIRAKTTNPIESELLLYEGKATVYLVRVNGAWKVSSWKPMQ
jgi:hypothetical protein